MPNTRLLQGRPKRVAAPYTGLVANGCRIPDTLITAQKQCLSISRHVVREKLSAIALVYPNFLVPSSGTQAEAGSGAAATITAKIARGYGSSSLVPVTFSGPIANNSFIVSDLVSIELDEDDALFALSLFEGAGGILASVNGQDYARGEAIKYAPSGLSAADLNWSISSGDAGYIYKPAAILGLTTKRTVAVFSDSKGAGFGDRFNDGSGNLGEIARSLGDLYAVANWSISGDSAAEFIASHANRQALVNLVNPTDIHLGFAYNDFTAGVSAANQVAALQTIAGYVPGKNIWGQTCAPSASSTDNFATVANQTSTQAAKVAFNTAMLAVPAGFAGVHNVGDALASGRNSNKWAEDSSQTLGKFVTGDGIHPNERGYARVKESGVVRI